MMIKSALLKNFSILFGGLIVVQIIAFLFSLILPRFFKPDEFAVFGVFCAIVFLLSELINAKLDVAVILGKTQEESKKISDNAIIVSLYLFAILILLSLIFLLVFPKIYFLIPFAVLMYGIHQPVLVYWNKIESYKRINAFRIIHIISSSVATIALVLLKVPYSLVFGFIIGLISANIYILFNYSFRFSEINPKVVIKKYNHFPKYAVASSVLNNASRNTIPILLSGFFSEYLVGLFVYATRLLNAPTGMYSSAMGQIYFKAAADEDKQKLRKLTKQIITITFLGGLIPTIILLLFGEQIFRFLFTEKWAEAGKVASILSISYLLIAVFSPISGIIDTHGYLKFELITNLILCVCRILAIIVGAYLGGFFTAIILYAIVGIFWSLYMLFSANNILKKIE